MTDVSRILKEIQHGEQASSDELLPLVYQELRRLAEARLRQERDGHSIQATELVHEAYLRLVKDSAGDWHSKGHFFSAAAEAMRRILIEHARRRKTLKHGGEMSRISWSANSLSGRDFAVDDSPDHLLVINEALCRLECEDVLAANMIKLRVFAGWDIDQIADGLQVAKATVYRHLSYARAYLIAESQR
ncbi:MAG: ECF-type sigma factor [Planctomycetota bacterium]